MVNYGDFITNLETSGTFIVIDKFEIRDNLHATVLHSNKIPNYKVDIPTYYYVLRMEKSSKWIDMYVPRDYFKQWNVGDTIK